MSIWGYEHRKIKHLSPLAFCLPSWKPHRWLVLFSSSLCDFSESLSLLVLVWLFSFLFFWCDTSSSPFLPSFPCSFLFLLWSNFLWSWYSVIFSAGFCWFSWPHMYHLRLTWVNSFTKNGDSTTEATIASGLWFSFSSSWKDLVCRSILLGHLRAFPLQGREIVSFGTIVF